MLYASDTHRLSPVDPFPASHIMFNHSATEKTNLPNQTLSASGIPNGLLKGSVFGNDIGVLFPCRILVNNPALSSSASP